MTRIVTNPNILGGKPIIESTPIRVALILGLLPMISLSNQLPTKSVHPNGIACSRCRYEY